MISGKRAATAQKMRDMRQPETLLQIRMHESPWSPEKCAAVWREADRILADPFFKKSRRCVTLFRRLIEHALEGGDEDGIKERTLGIEVFGREADYDTNTDPIVRMTANEIRKRLAQYYQSTSLLHEVQISLLPGNYLLRFDFGLRVDSSGTDPRRMQRRRGLFRGSLKLKLSRPIARNVRIVGERSQRHSSLFVRWEWLAPWR